MKCLPGLLFLLLAGLPAEAATPEAKAYPSHLMVDQDVVVCSRITGILEEVYVERGAAVTKGQALAQIDPREFDAAVNEAKEDMELARIEADRAQALSASNVLSKQDLEAKRSQYAVAVARWQKAKTLRDYASIRAPFAGIVTEKYARVGQKVIEDKADPLFKVTAMEPLLARIYVPEKDLLALRRGAPVEVVPVSFPEARTTGAVEFISPTVDAASGLLQVIIRVRREPAKAILRPGLAVEIRFSEPKH